MSHSLIGADCRTTCKIVAVALAGLIGMLMLSTSLVVAIAAWRLETEAATTRAPANALVIEAGKGATSATGDAPIVGASPPNRHNKETRGRKSWSWSKPARIRKG